MEEEIKMKKRKVTIDDIKYIEKYDGGIPLFNNVNYKIHLKNGETQNVYDLEKNPDIWYKKGYFESLYSISAGEFILIRMESGRRGLYRLINDGFNGGSVSRPSSHSGYKICYMIDLKAQGKVK